jgi:hypothetical protein
MMTKKILGSANSVCQESMVALGAANFCCTYLNCYMPLFWQACHWSVQQPTDAVPGTSQLLRSYRETRGQCQDCRTHAPAVPPILAPQRCPSLPGGNAGLSSIPPSAGKLLPARTLRQPRRLCPSVPWE